MSRISVLETPTPITPGGIAGNVAVVIDVLRATSSITTALSSGCRAVIPASSKDEALRLGASHPGALLGGEIGGKKIEGFDLGNSPADYAPEAVGGKTVIMTTSNGTKAILGAVQGGASEVLICSFLNLGAVAREVWSVVNKAGRDVKIVCSGSLGCFSLEDFACAGALAKALRSTDDTGALTLDESAVSALEVFDRYRGDVMAVFEDSPHGQDLRTLGYEADLERCAKVSSIDVVPRVEEHAIVA